MMLFLCGKGPAAEQILRQLAEEKHKVALFTHDGESIINVAREYGIAYSTRTVNDVAAWPYKPGAIASIGYLHIIKPEVVALVQGRAFNCHAALLPNHRGRSSVPWAILDGDPVTGITYHWIDHGIDTGNVLLQGVCHIASDETQASLFEKINRLMVAYWPAAIKLAFLDVCGVPQVGPSQYHAAGPPWGGKIDPYWPFEYTERFIRAMTYPPLPYAQYDGQEVRTLEAYQAMRRAEMDREWVA